MRSVDARFYAVLATIFIVGGIAAFTNGLTGPSILCEGTAACLLVLAYPRR